MSGVRCVVLHHTAGPATGEAPSLGVVEDGRPGLSGPLAQLVLGRSGTWYVVAAGLCHHTGATFEPWQGNTWAVGVEAEATGRDPWPPVQYSSYLRGARALADHYDVAHTRVLGHREIARPLGRKIDPNFDLATFRAALTSQESIVTTPAACGPHRSATSTATSCRPSRSSSAPRRESPTCNASSPRPARRSPRRP